MAIQAVAHWHGPKPAILARHEHGTARWIAGLGWPSTMPGLCLGRWLGKVGSMAWPVISLRPGVGPLICKSRPILKKKSSTHTPFLKNLNTLSSWTSWLVGATKTLSLHVFTSHFSTGVHEPYCWESAYSRIGRSVFPFSIPRKRRIEVANRSRLPLPSARTTHGTSIW
jgi:hypothetical protein